MLIIICKQPTKSGMHALTMTEKLELFLIFWPISRTSGRISAGKTEGSAPARYSTLCIQHERLKRIKASICKCIFHVRLLFFMSLGWSVDLGSMLLCLRSTMREIFSCLEPLKLRYKKAVMFFLVQ